MSIRAKDIDCVRFRQFMVSLDDNEVLIVLAARARGKVVAAGDHYRIRGKWINDNYLAVNNCVANTTQELFACYLLGEIRKRMFHSFRLDDVEVQRSVICSVD